MSARAQRRRERKELAKQEQYTLSEFIIGINSRELRASGANYRSKYNPHIGKKEQARRAKEATK